MPDPEHLAQEQIPGGEAQWPLEAKPQETSTEKGTSVEKWALEASVSRPFDYTCSVAFTCEEMDQ